MPAVGELVGRYRLEALLGEGGMGKVFRAFDEILRRRVALKVLLDEDGLDAESQARLLREARAAAALDHPHAVRVYDVGDDGGVAFIAMELVEGPSLSALLRTDPRREDVLRWLGEIAEALAAAHDLGLVHRDVKPDNVVIGKDGSAKVLDFGIARPADGASLRASLHVHLGTVTEKGMRIGTPAYMPPEQLAGEPVDGRADQFAWGVTAYEALSGVLPWGEPGDAVAHALAITKHRPTPLSEVAEGISADISAVVARAIAADRDARFASMRDVLEALGRRLPEPPRVKVGAGDAALAHAPTELAETTRQPALRERRWVPASVVGGALMVVLVAGFALSHLTRTSDARSSALPSGSPSPTTAVSGTDALGTEVPQPATSVREAAAAFARAEVAERLSVGQACDAYREAADRDPAFALAALRVATCRSSGVDKVDPARAYFRRAWDQRDRLGERDRLLLLALEPVYQRVPADIDEEARRLEAYIERYPGDWRGVFLLGRTRRGFREKIEVLDRVLAIEPRHGRALVLKAEALAYLGEFDAAYTTLERCLEVAPESTDCLEERDWISAELGECARMEADARRILAIGTDDSEGFADLANALYAQGRPLATVREVLRQRWSEVDTQKRPRVEQLDELRVAALAGNFEAAKAAATVRAEAVADDPLAATHAEVARLLAFVDEESGDMDGAAKAAASYVDRRDAWRPSPRGDDWALADDPVPALLAVQRANRAISPAEFETKRGAWLAAWEKRVEPETGGFLWVYAYAAAARTPEDGRAAVAAQGRYAPAPPYMPLSLARTFVGTTMLLAGRSAAAVDELQRASRNCYPVARPFESTWAFFQLGLAYDANGDRRGACGALKVVRDRWGSARPRSVTAERALARMRFLHCDGT